MEALKTVQADINAIVAEKRVLTALTRKLLPAVDRVYKSGEQVLVYSEQKKK